MTSRPSPKFSTASRSRLACLATSAMLLLGAALLTPIETANAGEWVQRSCSVGTEYIFPEGWESKDIEGYTQTPNDNCERFYNGGGLRVDIAPLDSGYLTLAGQMWSYKPPAGSAIAGGSLAVDMTAREGVALIGAKVRGESMILAKCESPGCFHYSRDVSITAVGASEIYEQAACFGKAAVCHTPEGEPFDHEGDGVFSAEGEISSAQVRLSTNATPAASELGGTLLNNTVSGKATLSFAATDSAGPGIYQVRVNVNGEPVLSETPSLNEGRCVATGTSEGARAFNYAQPCPTETPVREEINTAGLPDGTHALTVELEDAAGDIATIYSGTLTTVNHATVFTPTAAPVERGPCNGSPCDEHAHLIHAHGQHASWTAPFSKSATNLAGRLVDASGAPVKNAQVQLLQQSTAPGAPLTRIATASTDTNGSWKFKVAKGPSRLLRVAYFSHLLDRTPATTLDHHERVIASSKLTAPHTVQLNHEFKFHGQLAGSPLSYASEVAMQLKWLGKWRTIETIPTNLRGQFVYRYTFTAGPGSSYKFRALPIASPTYPFVVSEKYCHQISIRLRS